MAIPSPIVRNLEQGGIVRTMAIDLSDRPEDRAAVIEVLRSKLYADKILAPIREYSTNAFDAHVEAGIPERPIKITLPSIVSPEFRVRDYGKGLNPDEVEEIYIKYGRSTKRTTNAQTGQLGLGCKSAFAYGDNFLVISHNNGVRTTYNLTVNGICTILASEPTEEPSGMEIVVPVNVSDVKEVQSKCVKFFQYWEVPPILVGGDAEFHDNLSSNKDTSDPIFSGEGWEIRPSTDYYSRGEGMVIMGNIPYPIDFNIIASKMNITHGDKKEVLFDFVKANKVILRFGVGQLDFSASRESLEYTDKTVASVTEKIKEITDSIFDILSKKIGEAKTYWEALMIYNKIFGSDGEKLFKGDLSRLEGTYRGKFSWNGIVIKSGSFQEFHRWDAKLGYFDDKKWSLKTDTNSERNPVLVTYTTNHRGRLKKSYPTDYSYNHIPASPTACIIINDVFEKPISAETVVKWAMANNTANNPTPNQHSSRVYYLRFRDAAQEAEFFDKMNFESAPVTRVSKVYADIKAWRKSLRSPSGGNPKPVAERLPVRTFVPSNRKGNYGYYNSANWGLIDADIYETNGYYVEIEEHNVKINGQQQYELAPTVHYAHILFEALGEKVDRVYGFSRKNYEAKWFGEAVEDGQWVKLEEYFKSKKDAILNGKLAVVAKAAAYYEASNDGDACIGMKFAKEILPLLKNPNGAMYKICSEISDTFTTHRELISALRHFGIKVDFTHTGVDFKKSTGEVKTAYPLLNMLDGKHYIFSDGDSCGKGFISKVAEYINMVDGKNS